MRIKAILEVERNIADGDGEFEQRPTARQICDRHKGIKAPRAH